MEHAPLSPTLMEPLAIRLSPQADKSLVISRKAREGANDRCANFATMEAIRDSLAALDPVALDIVDDSHKHVGHAAAGGGGHYGLRIVSAQFIGKNTVARHRMIYSALGELMKSDIHALNIQAKTPDEI